MRNALALFLVVAACGGSQTSPPAPVAHKEPVPAPGPTAAPTPPGQRLGDDVTPTRYDLDLTVDPGKSETAGTVKIGVDIEQRSAVIWLHARDLTFSSVELVTADGKRFPATVAPAPSRWCPSCSRSRCRGSAGIAAAFQQDRRG